MSMGYGSKMYLGNNVSSQEKWLAKIDIVLYLNKYQYKEIQRYTFHTIKDLQTNYDLKLYYSLIIYMI